MKTINIEMPQLVRRDFEKVFVEISEHRKLHIAVKGENGAIIVFEYLPDNEFDPEWLFVTYTNKKNYYQDICEEGWITKRLSKEQRQELKDLLKLKDIPGELE